jgi:hypothetical protein
MGQGNENIDDRKWLWSIANLKLPIANLKMAYYSLKWPLDVVK